MQLAPFLQAGWSAMVVHGDLGPPEQLGPEKPGRQSHVNFLKRRIKNVDYSVLGIRTFNFEFI